MTSMRSDVLGLPWGRPLTRADLDQMPEDGHRYELIDGTLIVSAAPRPLHQVAAFGLARLLADCAPDSMRVLMAPVDVALADDTVLQPDVLLAAREAFTDRGLSRAPLLAAEVLSPSTAVFDLNSKRARLEQAGCQHYWVLDPDAPSLQMWALGRSGRYSEVAHAVGEQEILVEEPFPVTIVPARLLD